ncbi:MAG: IS110 family transposase [Pseudomonadota bacterium]
MNATTYAADIAKNVFQVHWVDPLSGEIGRKKLSRAKFCEFFASRQPARIVMEACGGAHHWGRTFEAMGHTVELLPAKQVRAFVWGNKDDAADARAIWMAAQHHDIRRVPAKTMAQQAVQFLHRTRAHWVSMRTATVNLLRSMLYEFGVLLPQGKNCGLKALAEQRAALDEHLPAAALRLIDAQIQVVRDLDGQVSAVEAELALVQKQSETAKRLRAVPGIGLLGATALAALLGKDGRAWRNAREFACCLGLVPKHTGTGGKVQMGGISKRGDPYIRTILISGARCVMAHLKNPPDWIGKLQARRPPNVVAVAIANKLARMAWAIVARGCDYDQRWSVSSDTAGLHG